MYLDHRVTAKITRILEQIDMSALLMDSNGTVVLPEGDNRQLLTCPTSCAAIPPRPWSTAASRSSAPTTGQPAVHLPARRFAGGQELRHPLRGTDQHAGARGSGPRHARTGRAPDAARRGGGRGTGIAGGGTQHRPGEEPLRDVLLLPPDLYGGRFRHPRRRASTRRTTCSPRWAAIRWR